MKKITLTYCGMAGEGPTVAAAKQDAARKIEAVLSADYSPVIIIGRRNGDELPRINLLWHTPQGIVSSFPDHHTGRIRGTCHHGAEDMQTATRYAKFNMAQHDTLFTEDDLPIMATDLIRDDENLMRDYLNWVGFQCAYRHAKKNFPDQGEGQWHEFALRHDRQFAPKQVSL